jgi:hypothetical protein
LGRGDVSPLHRPRELGTNLSIQGTSFLVESRMPDSFLVVDDARMWMYSLHPVTWRIPSSTWSNDLRLYFSLQTQGRAGNLRGKQRQQLSGALRVNIGHWLGLFLHLPESWQFRPVPPIFRQLILYLRCPIPVEDCWAAFNWVR